jgi:hypothetical protein
MSLPYAARGVLANNDSVKTEGLVGMITAEYRVLVPLKRSSVILGGRGGVSSSPSLVGVTAGNVDAGWGRV